MNPVVLFSNNLRSFKLDDAAVNEMGYTIKDISQSTLPFDFARNSKIRQCWQLTKNITQETGINVIPAKGVRNEKVSTYISQLKIEEAIKIYLEINQ